MVRKLKHSLRVFFNRHTWHFKYSDLKGCAKVGRNCKVCKPLSTNGLENVEIADNFLAGEGLKLRTFSHWRGRHFTPKISIGSNVSMQSNCHISAINSVTIDDNVLMASFIYISDHSHGEPTVEMMEIPPLERPLFSKGPIHICRNVWLGEKVSVMPGVTIGEGSIIGANSVVTKDIPPYCVACGAPAKVIKKLK